MRAKSAKSLESCSFWLECIPGSSATMTTSPPFILTSAEFTKGSIATLSPTCFIETMVRLPAKDTPSADSYAVFSLVHHWATGRKSLAPMLSSLSVLLMHSCKYSMISVAGVPGYAKAAVIPESIAACAIASSPERRTFCDISELLIHPVRQQSKKIKKSAGTNLRQQSPCLIKV